MYRIFSLVAVAALVVFPMSADKSHQTRADVLLDQSDTNLYADHGYDGQYNLWGQTFTVGLNGKLDSVAVSTLGGNTTIQIYDTVSGFPNDLLATNSAYQPTGEWNTISFSQYNIPVYPGEQLALVATGVGLINATNGDYAGGTGLYARPIDGQPWQQTVEGLAFQTYVDVTPAPEPCTLSLLCVGAIGLVVYGWNKRRSRLRLSAPY